MYAVSIVSVLIGLTVGSLSTLFLGLMSGIFITLVVGLSSSVARADLKAQESGINWGLLNWTSKWGASETSLAVSFLAGASVGITLVYGLMQ